MADATFIDIVRRKFKDRLMTKTGWGRNDVMAEFDVAILEAEIEASRQLALTDDAEFDEKVLRVLERVNLIVRK